MNQLTKPSKKVKQIQEQERKNWEAWKKVHDNIPQRA